MSRIKNFLVTEELTRSQTVELDIPAGCLEEDGSIPEYNSNLRYLYEEFVTASVYLRAHTDGNWDTKTRETDWEEANG